MDWVGQNICFCNILQKNTNKLFGQPNTSKKANDLAPSCLGANYGSTTSWLSDPV